MIRFKRVTYGNFLSTGDQPNTINLDQSVTTIFTGANGAGKSTFIDAIVYTLFGKPFRKVRLGQLINNVNEKGLMSEVEFSIGSKDYLVKRGMKPGIFEIYVNGEMIPQPATNADYQNILENDILKLNYKSFTQIVVLGSASFKPFMQLKLGDRREIIEDLLDISVFSEMNVILKGTIKECKDDIVSISHKLELLKERHSSKREYVRKLENDHKERLDEIKRKIVTVDAAVAENKLKLCTLDDKLVIDEVEVKSLGNVEEELKLLQTSINEINMTIFTTEQAIDTAKMDRESVSELNTKVDENNSSVKVAEGKIEELRAKLEETEEIIASYGDFSDRDQVKADIAIKSNEIVVAKNNLKFYTDNDDCPECKQSIEPAFKAATIAEITENIQTLQKDLDYCYDRIDTIEREIKEKADFTKTATTLNDNISVYTTAIDKLNSSTEMIKEELSNKVVKSDDEMAELENAITLLKSDRESCETKTIGFQERNNRLTSLKESITITKQNIAVCSQSIKADEIRLKSLQDDLKTLNEKPVIGDNKEEIEKLAVEIKEQDANLTGKKGNLHYFGIVQKLLKDDGLKTKIIRKFLPIINATANKYLDKFDFPINFTFDENFNETIQSNFRNDFCYYSFSEGEKSRIDLALLFTWRETALKKSRNATNIIIFDEIFDGSLDVDGIENFMSILGIDRDGYSSFVITHKDDTINSRFDRVIEFEKPGHFSKMMES